MAKNALQQTLRCSEELQAVIKEKKTTRGGVMKGLWTYIKRKGLQLESDKRIIECDDKLTALFGKAVKESRKITMRGKTTKVKAGMIHMTEIGGAIQKHLSKD